MTDNPKDRGPAISPARANLLVVDDTPANLKLLVRMLMEQGYNVRVSNNGPAAIDIARENPVDLILLDIRMPRMDGFAVCEKLKASETTFEIPVIFITAVEDVRNKVRAFSVGGVDYITKPFHPEEVLARVENHLTLRDMKRSLEQKNAQLGEALAKIRTLRGLLPICANCKKIRDDKGYWNQIEEYIQNHSDAFFSHGICPDCMNTLYGDQEWFKKRDG